MAAPSPTDPPAPATRRTVDWGELRHRLDETLVSNHRAREAEILRRRAEAVARPVASTPTAPAGTHELVLFRIDTQLIGVDSFFAREAVLAATFTPLPGLPPTCRGLANIRGQIVPIFDLRPLLRIAPPPAIPAIERVLVLTFERADFGLIVDEMRGSRTLPADGLRQDVPALQAQFLRGLADDGTLVLDVPAIAAALSLEERS